MDSQPSARQVVPDGVAYLCGQWVCTESGRSCSPGWEGEDTAGHGKNCHVFLFRPVACGVFGTRWGIYGSHTAQRAGGQRTRRAQVGGSLAGGPRDPRVRDDTCARRANAGARGAGGVGGAGRQLQQTHV
eukprot:scaffold1591_cov109-Isochrysis_galbana.AAC.6